MYKIILLPLISFALAGCGATPATTDTAREAQGDEAADEVTAQSSENESGLGTVAYDEQTRRSPCKKRRRTGSHLYTDGCADPDGGSRPVRRGDWNSLGRYVVTGRGLKN